MELKGRGLKKLKIGHGGLHQILENTQEVTFLTPLLCLDLRSTLKNSQYYSTHLWCIGSEANMWFRRKQRGTSQEAGFWEVIDSICAKIWCVSTEQIRRLQSYIYCRKEIIFLVLQSIGTNFPTLPHLCFLNVFNTTLKFLIEKSSREDP